MNFKKDNFFELKIIILIVENRKFEMSSNWQNTRLMHLIVKEI